jgi:dihydrodipicolinate synthase/N-acetylneuraminate lyase
VPSILRNRPSGTALPDFLTLAAPFTPFNATGGVDAAAVGALARMFKRRLGITAVWVMGMRGQFDTLTVPERKAVRTRSLLLNRSTL